MNWQKRRNRYVQRKRRPVLRLFLVSGVLTTFLLAARSLSLLPQQAPVPPPRYADRFARKKEYRQSLHMVTHQVKSGDTFYQVLLGHGVEPPEIEALATAAKPHRDLQNLKAGENLQLFFSRSLARLEKVRCLSKDGLVLTVSRTPWNWVASNYSEPVFVRTALAQGTIKDSLYQSALNSGIDFDLALALADIFAWDIDFFVDLRPEDKYAFMYEQRFRNGEFVGNGRILVARFDNAGTRHQAYFYQVPGRGGDYYDAEGRSLRKQFLKSPLRYTRISSRFSRRRLHPIFKIYRPHLGIDYAAPIGTPVAALGDGRVVFKGRKTGYGRFTEIRHNQIYSSTYGHLSRFATGLKRGATVKQGQVIGYVGASGRATGPHLDFRFKKGGRFVNPLRVRFPAARPVPREQLDAFQTYIAALEGQLVQALARVENEATELPPTLTAFDKDRKTD